MARVRTVKDFLRKLAALSLVLASFTAGIIGLGAVTAGDLWGVALLVATPFGVWAATRITPVAGSSTYCDENL